MAGKGKLSLRRSFTDEKVRYADWLIFALALAVYTAVMFYLFYHQCLLDDTLYRSDMEAYLLEMQGLESGYDFPYPVFFSLGALLNLFMPIELAASVVLTVLNSLSPILMKYYLTRELTGDGDFAGKDSSSGRGNLALGIGITVLTFSLFFVSMLFPLRGQVPGIKDHYVGVFSPNPYHNATYLAVRPFAIICFFQFADLLKNYEKAFSWKKAIAFSVMLLIATLTKPSFTLVLVGTAGLIMLYRLIKSRFANFRQTVYLGIMFIPTFCALLYQYGGVFVSSDGSESGIGFGFLTAWSYFCDNFPMALLLGLAFPIVVLIVHHRELKENTIYRFSIQFLAVGLGMAVFLYEKGDRLLHMNFSWGYMHGQFFAFTGAALVLAGATIKKEKKWYVLAPEWLLFLCHLVCGCLYFLNGLAGNYYY